MHDSIWWTHKQSKRTRIEYYHIGRIISWAWRKENSKKWSHELTGWSTIHKGGQHREFSGKENSGVYGECGRPPNHRPVGIPLLEKHAVINGTFRSGRALPLITTPPPPTHLKQKQHKQNYIRRPGIHSVSETRELDAHRRDLYIILLFKW